MLFCWGGWQRAYYALPIYCGKLGKRQMGMDQN